MNKTAYQLIVFLIIGPGCLANGALAKIEPAKPNIVIIVADDLGWGDVGFHGSQIKTPNIDTLAETGIVLDRFYVAPVCTPTRAGLLTGKYPNRFGVREVVIPPWRDFGIAPEEVFLPEELARAGYKNRAIIGKWHLGHSSRKYYPLNQGFTHFYGHLNGAIDYFTHEREGELDWHNDWESSYDRATQPICSRVTRSNALTNIPKRGRFSCMLPLTRRTAHSKPRMKTLNFMVLTKANRALAEAIHEGMAIPFNKPIRPW